MPRNFTLQQAARLLGTGRNRLTRTLKERGILDQQCLPRQRDVDAGRFKIDLRSHTGNYELSQPQLYGKTLVTPKGLQWLAGQLGVTITNADQEAA